MGFGGASGGGGGALSGSSDVALNTPLNNQVLAYNSSTAKWSNNTIAGSAIGLIEYSQGAWPSRPASASAQIFVSTKDAGAPEPTGMVVGDMWIRHPDALEQL